MKNKNNSSAENINYRKVSSTSIEHSFLNTSSEHSHIENQIYIINTNKEFIVKNSSSKKVLEKDSQ